MGVDDACLAADYVGTKKVIGMHFDTFPPITIDHDAATKTFDKAGLTLKLPTIGECFNFTE